MFETIENVIIIIVYIKECFIITNVQLILNIGKD